MAKCDHFFFLKIWRLFCTQKKSLGTQFFTLGSFLCSHKGNEGACHTHTHTHTHGGLATYIKKYVKAKEEEELMETQIFHHAKIY
jgi:hypothetical protein